jgi:hypothetical protein
MLSCLVADILSRNPEYVVVYKNHGIYLIYLVSAYTLLGNPEHFVISVFPHSM